MSQVERVPALNPDDPDYDPALERILRDRKQGEIETGMMTGSDDSDISSTERFEGEITPEEALKLLDPEGKSSGPHPD